VAQAWQSLFLQRFQQTSRPLPVPASEQTPAPSGHRVLRPAGLLLDVLRPAPAPFMNEDGSPKSGDAPPVSPAMVEFVRKAHAIRQAFFAAGPQPS